ncbi:uncharacterized protein I303_106929 [Kwoniella dejecticola CBS 10117]|uniref:Short-chain dehydrogenase/reductase SDR n=1 Tax=Kwoniella dejecticola CBS 10117 TaxID=1296121 RepID=A0A1A5ZTG0_9TREE|nr:uncharacterized protein I303_08432 [Kwoniella dejecticola CBS 10117]OBR81050.1 hypothetical protein I303_08432 [Kwoniella dejecticola CBS 10117]
MTSLLGKKALITGGSAGIGAEVARQLALQGVTIAINFASNERRAADTISSLQGSGHALIQGDAFDKEDIKRFATAAAHQLGGLDIVISNAGWTSFGDFDNLHSVSDDDWLQCYKSNVLSHLWLMQACQEEIRKTRGCFIVSASVAGVKPSGSSMAYSVSKSATIHLAKSLAIACAPDIRVNTVAAGVMLTEWSKGFTDAQIAAVKRINSLHQVTSIADVASAYVMLAQNGSMTGQTIEVSSGFRLGRD